MRKKRTYTFRKPPSECLRRGPKPKAVKAALVAFRVPLPQLALLALLRGGVLPGAYIGGLLAREAKRRKLIA